MQKYRCKCIKKGFYIYRGIEIKNLGYCSLEKRCIWEGNKIGCSKIDYHSFSLNEIKILIDND